MRYSRLTTIAERRLFDPTKRSDQIELKFYIENNRWKGSCPFYVEYPWEDIPTMCKDKYAAHQLSKLKQKAP